MRMLRTPPGSCHLGRSLADSCRSRQGKAPALDAAIGAAGTQSPECRWSVAVVPM